MLRVSTHRYSDGTEHVNVGGRYIENTFFYSFEYRMFYILYPFVTYLLTLRRINCVRVCTRMLLGKGEVFFLYGTTDS
jgi:hypothetical protein